MGSKTNRNLLAKHDKAKRQRREMVEAENTKSAYVLAKSRDKAALDAALAEHNRLLEFHHEQRARLQSHF